MGMAEQAPTQEPAGNDLRAEGRVLCRNGELAKAIAKFRAVVAIDPSDTESWVALSGAYFEAGHYISTIIASKKSLALVDENEKIVHYVIRLRLLSSYIQTRQMESASQVADELGAVGNRSMKVYLDSIEQIKQVWVAFPEEKAAWEQLVNLPRYKETACPVSQSCAYGHDEPRPQYDEDLVVNDADTVSFFFAGVGDARHLYATVLRIAQEEAKPDSAEPNRKYYFTINDCKASIFARNLIMFRLLDELSEQDDQSSEASVSILNTIFFIFAGTVIPRYTFSRLQRCIRNVKKILRTGQGLPDYLFIHPEDHRDIINVLKSWQGQAQSFYSTSDAMKFTAELSGKSDRTTFTAVGARQPPPGCEDELRLYKATGFLQPADSLFRNQDAILREILMRYRYRVNDSIGEVKKYLADHWRVNVTVLDPEWELNRPFEWTGFRSDPINLGHKLYKFSGIRRPRGCICTQDYVAPYFWHVAQSLKKLKDRITIEISLGDAARELEKRRYGLVPERSQTPAPKNYHRIHFGDTLDITGGYLTSFIYGLPMCKTDAGCYVTSVCLRTAGTWASVVQYLNDSLALRSYAESRKLLQAEQSDSVNDDPQLKLRALPMWSYVHWNPSKSRPHSYSALMSRQEFTKWSYRIFFKLAVPFYPARPIIDAPLNLTMFFRVLARMQEIGYPKQWLSMVLTHILEDMVETNIRPPQAFPQTLDELNTEFPTMRLSTAPFVYEMSTLASLYQRVLPFAVVASGLSPPQDIYEYTMHLPVVADGDPLRPVIVLVFVSQSFADLVHSGEQELSLRAVLDFDLQKIPESSRAQVTNTLRKDYKVQTTIKLHHQVKKVTFWMQEGVVESMTASKKWKYGLWRTDDWKKTSQLHDVNEENVQRGQPWVRIPEASRTNDHDDQGDNGAGESRSNVSGE